MPPRRQLLPALAAALVLALAGCGGSDEEVATGPASNPGAGETPPESQAGAKVSMVDIAFKPAKLEVKAGETVAWINEDTIEHNVVATSGADFRSELFGEGKSFEFKADEAGTIEYVCTIHPGMDGTITVKG